MPTTNVACPYCGKDTRGTLPSEDAVIKAVSTFDGEYPIQASCSNCKKKFSIAAE
ncbi:hypothetical protein [Halobellus rufus]|uniref:hypothetical protein n=1 Tax=Halobellus rufus TaxID=1448860 RepID=UPI0012E072AA|nr:hypothetical protein [Halobellus rufus]